MMNPADLDNEDEGDLVPLGAMLEIVALEEQLRVANGERALTDAIEQEMEARFRGAMAEVMSGRRTHALDGDSEETQGLWRLLAWMHVIEAHGGEVREWIGGEWKSRMRRQCARGCRWCRPKAEVRAA